MTLLSGRYSHGGNVLFPVWEYGIPIVGMFSLVYQHEASICSEKETVDNKKKQRFSKMSSSLPSISQNPFI